jgi:hypothetical protein
VEDDLPAAMPVLILLKLNLSSDGLPASELVLTYPELSSSVGHVRILILLKLNFHRTVSNDSSRVDDATWLKKPVPSGMGF